METIQMSDFYNTSGSVLSGDVFFLNENSANINMHRNFIETFEHLPVGDTITVAFFSVKHYIYLCENYGSMTGVTLGNAIEENFCQYLSEDEHFCHVAENMFAIMLRTNAESSVTRLRSCFELIAEHLAYKKCPVKALFNCGVYEVPEIEKNTRMPIRNAYTALKHANGINTISDIVVFSDEIRAAEERRQTIENDLGDAVKNNEFIIEIQPKYDLKTGNCVSAEALVRWMHPKLGKIPPDEFIPYAEKTGDIIAIDMLVLETVCKNMRRWFDMGVNPVPIAVNQSRLHITDPNYVESVFAMMQEYDVWPNLIELETTESIAFNNYESVTDILKQLHNYGFVLSMDDFGSGYSSLHMLSELEYDVLKLDQKMVQLCDGENNERIAIIIRNVIQMAHSLNMIVVAEGIETEEQAELLRCLDCDLAQGFLYSHPLPIDKFDATVFGIFE